MTQLAMVQCSIVGRLADAEPIVEALQDAGVMHIAAIPVPADEAEGLTLGIAEAVDGSNTRQAYERLAVRMDALKSVVEAPARLQVKDLSYDAVCDELDRLRERRDENQRALERAEATRDTLAAWGDFSPEDLAAVEGAGLSVAFVEMSESEWAERAANRGTLVSKHEGVVRVLYFDKDFSKDEVPGTRVDIPRASLSAVNEELAALQTEAREIRRELGRFFHFAPLIAQRMNALRDRLALLDALDEAVSTGTLFALEGFLPRADVVDLESALEPFDCALRVKDAVVEDERVPVKLKNAGIFSGFESIVQAFSGIRYGEKDFTWAVGILFITFGSLCLLDAGYGLMLLITGVIVGVRGNPAMGKVFGLTGLISVVVGLLVGQFFGLVVGQHVMMDSMPPLTLAQKPYDAFIFSLVVGMVALTFSYSVAIWQRGLKTHATGSLFLVLAAAAAVYGSLGAEYVHTLLGGWQPPSAAVLANAKTVGMTVSYGLLGLAVLAWLAFPEPVFGKKARVGNIIWTLYSGSTGFVQDVLSHMRLFGIALSGSIMALVVNQIGGQLPLPLTALFAVFGHFFVFLLALLSLYIHTNRLIFLEWGSKCIDGGSNFYTPLSRSAH